MDAERTLLKSVALEVIIPEDTTSSLPDLLSADDGQSTDSIGLLEIRRRSLLFIGVTEQSMRTCGA